MAEWTLKACRGRDAQDYEIGRHNPPVWRDRHELLKLLAEALEVVERHEASHSAERASKWLVGEIETGDIKSRCGCSLCIRARALLEKLT